MFEVGNIVRVKNGLIDAMARVVNVRFDTCGIVFYRTVPIPDTDDHLRVAQVYGCARRYLTLSNQEELEQWFIQQELMS